MQEISYYTKLVLSPEIQTLIDPFRNALILVSIIFLIISLILIFQEKRYISKVKRKIIDFFSNPKRYGKPKKFVILWNQIDKAYKNNDYKKMIINSDRLMLKALKRIGYVGDDCCKIFDEYQMEDDVFPNIENARKISELSKDIKKGKCVDLNKGNMSNTYNLIKDTFIKIGILNS